MDKAAASTSPAIWRRGAHEVSLVRLYALRAVALFFAVDGLFTKLPYVTHPDQASRGIVASLLAALWVCAFFTVRYPLRMIPIFLFELIWKTLWLLDYGAPQWLAGAVSPRLGRDLFEIGFFPIPIALIIPWGHIWRRYVRAPAERWRRPAGDASAPPDTEEPGPGGISPARLNLVRGAFLLAAIAGCALVLPGMIRPDPVARGMQESMIAGLWVSAFIGLLYPLRMLPILLFAFVGAALWLVDYGLPRGLSGAVPPQFQSDLPAIGVAFILFVIVIPWGYVWRRYIGQRSERWR
jgi:hypothetical protein